MYTEFIKRKLTHNPRKDVYVMPNLPAVKLGKMLMKETRVKSPGDVVAFHSAEGLFSSGFIILTKDHCYHEDGQFNLEDLKSVKADGKRMAVALNNMGQIEEQQIKFGNEDAAKAFEKALGDLVYHDPNEKELPEPVYENYEGAALDWLLLRDEVMKTIDMLHERFNDGKLSLLEYEEKKADLLSRL